MDWNFSLTNSFFLAYYLGILKTFSKLFVAGSNVRCLVSDFILFIRSFLTLGVDLSTTVEVFTARIYQTSYS